jgi:hypothetical protein
MNIRPLNGARVASPSANTRMSPTSNRIGLIDSTRTNFNEHYHPNPERAGTTARRRPFGSYAYAESARAVLSKRRGKALASLPPCWLPRSSAKRRASKCRHKTEPTQSNPQRSNTRHVSRIRPSAF